MILFFVVIGVFFGDGGMVFFSSKFISDPEGQLQRQVSTVFVHIFYLFCKGSSVKCEESQYSNLVLPFFPGFSDLTNKQMVTSLISLYAQVVMWFCRSSLLPEGLGKQNL